MRPQPMRRPNDCLATAIAAMLDLDVLDVPWTGAPDWYAAYQELRRWLAARGWRIGLNEYEGPPDCTLPEILQNCRDEDDAVDAQLLWLVSISHPTWNGARHVVVVRAGEIVFDPGSDVLARPPLEEMAYHGAFMLSPLDPARFTLGDA